MSHHVTSCHTWETTAATDQSLLYGPPFLRLIGRIPCRPIAAPVAAGRAVWSSGYVPPNHPFKWTFPLQAIHLGVSPFVEAAICADAAYVYGLILDAICVWHSKTVSFAREKTASSCGTWSSMEFNTTTSLQRWWSLGKPRVLCVNPGYLRKTSCFGFVRYIYTYVYTLCLFIHYCYVLK